MVRLAVLRLSSKMNKDPEYYIEKLALIAHPEGGYFVESYRSEELLSQEGLPERFEGSRSISTAIYFLLKGTEHSAFHRIKSDEIWHFYEGIPLLIYVINLEGKLEVIKLGNELDTGCTYQATVKAGNWFASKPINEHGFSLVGCTVAPGFDFSDFELAGNDLLDLFPRHSDIIRDLMPL